MNRTFLPNYNFEITLLGGQAFSWDYDPLTEIFTGFTQENFVKVKRDPKNPDYVFWQTYPEKDNWQWLSGYLRADVDYENIIKNISKDEHIKKAVEHYKGLRLLKQDFRDAVIGYLCSPTKTIVGIRQCVRLMRDRYGEEVIVDGEKTKLFPRIERLAQADLADILQCKVGFRGQNIKLAAERLANSDVSLEIHEMQTDQALETLKSFRGIGDKVADCIAVYSLSRDELTPFDVWGMRVLQKYYDVDANIKYDKMRAWVKDYFGDKASWAGQYLFEYIRLVDSKKNEKFNN